eukprot:9299597-Alexandrium_andersonii.AAC.1
MGMCPAKSSARASSPLLPRGDTCNWWARRPTTWLPSSLHQRDQCSRTRGEPNGIRRSTTRHQGYSKAGRVWASSTSLFSTKQN